jgi:cyclic pyranopterin phosphate synthase
MIRFNNGMDADVIGCNLSCAACNHFAPIADIPVMEPDELRHDLGILSKFAHTPRMCILGGEPTLHPKVDEFLRVVSESGISDGLEITTNGTRLHLMTDEFWKSIDVLYVSLYDGVDIDENLKLAKAKSEEYGFSFRKKKFFFYKVMTKSALSEFTAQQHYETCVLRTLCHAVYHGYFYRCPGSKIIPSKIMGLPAEVDGIALDDSLTEKKLRAFMGEKKHMESCHRCSQQQEFIQQRQVRREDWIEASSAEE